MSTDFPTAPLAPGHKGAGGGAVEKSHHASHTKNLTLPVLEWAKNHKAMFSTPTGPELLFVAEILKIKHFQGLIGAQQRLKGTPVADPFVIACARIKKATVVTEEGWQRGGKALALKPNAAKIPNVCAHFKIPCVDLEGFMHQQGWAF
jgi:hypothetical protein